MTARLVYKEWPGSRAVSSLALLKLLIGDQIQKAQQELSHDFNYLCKLNDSSPDLVLERCKFEREGVLWPNYSHGLKD